MYHFAGQTAPETVKITTMIYYMGFQEAAFLFGQMGDVRSAANYATISAAIKTAAAAAYFDSSMGTFGDRIQTNAMAVFSGIADRSQHEAIFQRILSQPPSEEITPYFDYFVLEAMEMTGHRPAALELIREVWGGMLHAGATTFWEIDPPGCASAADVGQCLIGDFDKLSSQGTRDVMSMAHGWASGPAAFLMKSGHEKEHEHRRRDLE